jgi:hypothetical protein
MFSLIESLLVTGFMLLSFGGIAEITYDLAKASAEHQQISLGQWNRALYGEANKEGYHRTRATHHKPKKPEKGGLNNLLRDFG